MLAIVLCLALIVWVTDQTLTDIRAIWRTKRRR
jgi:hypothetical protein